MTGAGVQTVPGPAPVPDRCDTGVVDLRELRFGRSPRFREEDARHTRALAEIAAELLPPIIVHRPSMIVIDGLHRSRAALLRGERTIRARFFDGTPDEAFLLSVEANRSHGLPLSLAERKAAAAELVRAFPARSDRSIAASTGLSDKTVTRLRRANAENPHSNTRLGIGGPGRPADRAGRRRLAAQLLTLEPRAPLRKIAGEVGISPATVLDVRRRLARGEDPVPSGPDRGGGARPRRPARDPQAVLRNLRNDPALRSSEAGRDLLRWLHAQALGRDRCDTLVGSSPPHCHDLIADLAEAYAEAWQGLSRRLRTPLTPRKGSEP